MKNLFLSISLILLLAFIFGCVQPSICGDGFCLGNENSSNCPADCEAKVPEYYYGCSNGMCKQIEGVGASQCSNDSDCSMLERKTVTSSTGEVNEEFLTKSGERILSLDDLKKAYINGDILITIGENEPSVRTKKETASISLDITGCYHSASTYGYNGDRLVYTGYSESFSRLFDKKAVLSSVNNNESYANLEGLEFDITSQLDQYGYEFTANGCCYICANSPCIGLKGIYDLKDCNDYQGPNSNGKNTQFASKLTDGWKVNVYEYDLVYGSAKGLAEMGVDPVNGIITMLNSDGTKPVLIKPHPDFNSAYYYGSKETDWIGRWCCASDSCDPIGMESAYVGVCSELPYNKKTTMLDCSEESIGTYCFYSPVQVPNLTVSYYTKTFVE